LQVKWRQWFINPHCLHPDIKTAPTEFKSTHEEFIHDIEMQGVVANKNYILVGLV